MSYDIYFLDLKSGQTWEEALEELEEHEGEPPTQSPQWGTIVAQARELFGEVSVTEGPPNWELVHGPTGIQLGHIEGEWSLKVPYWTEGDAAARVLANAFDLAVIVEHATGLRGYDPQLDQPVAELVESRGQAGREVFDTVAQQFRR
ncbi:hypothetical protein Lfu02_01970 [Longispora fulva]|uniref:Uncharacterized protein n=1 Tax=Longispora fulva TaxID=619741 RepID=A0A8J7GS04_9ACTN|nr:hypothetical protein [Longispora fulva]MBG6135931.1 hypothetical protein [Longispora fulva]GIG55825.1 hypothetical protein Lfu02_01970 [Longispora fulva]